MIDNRTLKAYKEYISLMPRDVPIRRDREGNYYTPRVLVVSFDYVTLQERVGREV